MQYGQRAGEYLVQVESPIQLGSPLIRYFELEGLEI